MALLLIWFERTQQIFEQAIDPQDSVVIGSPARREDASDKALGDRGRRASKRMCVRSQLVVFRTHQVANRTDRQTQRTLALANHNAHRQPNGPVGGAGKADALVPRRVARVGA